MLSSTIEAPLNEHAMYSRYRNRLLGFITFLIVVSPSISVSQPSLMFYRATINWPTVELYMDVSCDGNTAYTMTKQNFRILENGKEVPEFTLWCPDPFIRCSVSLTLITDVSGSMHGTGMTEAQMGMTALTQLMDGSTDEAALITAGGELLIRQPMTTNTTLLRQSIDSLKTSGSSAITDGIMEGLRYIIDNGVNQCRAVIVFSDGLDNSSTSTPQEIITLANRHRIRVYTIGVGTVVDPVALEQIAMLTGGRYYQNPGAGQIAAIYQEISAIGHGINECIITYERDCADGSMRTIELQLNDFCGGSDMKTKTYRAPLDSTSFSYQHLRFGETTSIPRDIVTVPLLLDAVPNDSLLRPFDVTIYSGAPGRPLFDVTIPAGSPLDGAPLIIDLFSDSVRLRLTGEIAVQSSGILLEMQFSTSGIFDSTWFPLTARMQDAGALCSVTRLDSGGYRIVPRLLPRITPEGVVMMCPNGEVELQANEGFVAYAWSTGDTTRTIVARSEGNYFLRVIDVQGDTLDAVPVTVQKWPERKVRLEPSGPLTFCRNGAVTFRVAGDTANVNIFWQNYGYSQRTFTSKQTDMIWATVEDEHGCRHSTDTMFVTVTDPPVTLNVQGKSVYICPGDSIELRVEEEYPFYYWSKEINRGDSTRSVMARASGGWLGTGEYSVRVRDSNGCNSSWHTIYVREYPKRTLTFAPAQRIMLCPGGEAEVSVAEEFASYRWSTGDTTRAITVRSPGTLTVEGFSENGCVTRSATFEIEMVDTPHPRISPGRYSTLCADDRVLLDAGDGYAAYRWSTGDTTRINSVGDPGPFFVDVMTYGGCWGRSDTITIQQEMTEYPEITYSGDLLLCSGDSLRLEAPEGYAKYFWSTGDTLRSIRVHQQGLYAVSVLSAGGCEGTSNAVYVQVRTSAIPIIVKQGLTLSTSNRVAAHQWFLDGQPISGATGPVLDITQTGRYTVQVIDSCGAVLMSEELLVTTLGIAAGPTQFRLDVYPDPGDGMIHIAITGIRGEVQAELLDLLG
ncbi:MAG: VWA domain-containing protein, partial [Bacteroidota bacterium]